jgi:phthiodiolone/phenolphthiodiolone dimycocerosates ketoreductase
VATAAGRDPGAIVPSLQPYIVVAPTRDEAQAMFDTRAVRFFGLLVPGPEWRKLGFAHPFGEGFRGIIDFLPEQYSRAELDEAIASVPVGLREAGLLWGTPKEIAAQLRPFVEAGMRHVVPQAMSAAISRKHALYSLRALRTIRLELN